MTAGRLVGWPVGWSAGRLAVGLWSLYRAVAVTEALEVVVRAGFGKNCCDNLATAVTDALEVVIRAVLGAQNPDAVSAPLKALKRRRNVGKRFKTGAAPFRRR